MPIEEKTCPCCSGLSYQVCCFPYHQYIKYPTTALALMQSRYCAYALHLTNYLLETTHPSKRHLYGKSAIENWAKQNSWLKLEICKSSKNEVEFKAYYHFEGKLYIHHEYSIFKKENGKWYYLEAV